MIRKLIPVLLICVVISCKHSQTDAEEGKSTLIDLDKVNVDTYTMHTTQSNSQINEEVISEQYSPEELLTSEFKDFIIYKLALYTGHIFGTTIQN